MMDKRFLVNKGTYMGKDVITIYDTVLDKGIHITPDDTMELTADLIELIVNKEED